MVAVLLSCTYYNSLRIYTLLIMLSAVEYLVPVQYAKKSANCFRPKMRQYSFGIKLLLFQTLTSLQCFLSLQYSFSMTSGSRKSTMRGHL